MLKRLVEENVNLRRNFSWLMRRWLNLLNRRITGVLCRFRGTAIQLSVAAA
jgi:hypothetical protein